jgi:hypothetical protein
MSVQLGRLSPEHWLALFEAAASTSLRHGTEPFGGELRKLASSAPPSLRGPLMAEVLTQYLRGRAGDDAVYDAAVFVDAIKCDPDELLSAHLAVPLATQHLSHLLVWEWPVALVPPVRALRGDIPPDVLTNVELIPPPVGFAREWMLCGILKPIIKDNAELVPEVLALALGEAGRYNCRADILAAFAPDLLGGKPAAGILERARMIEEPYHRTRALVRLGRHWPERRTELLREAEEAARGVDGAVRLAQIADLLTASATDPQSRARLWSWFRHLVPSIDDADERSRAWGRLGLLATRADAAACYLEALAAAETIPEEFARSTTARLLRRIVRGFPELRDLDDSLRSGFQDPILAARATEDWGGVFRHLTPRLQDDASGRQAWAVLSLTAQADREVSETTDLAAVWSRLADAPSEETVRPLIVDMDDLIPCTPLAVQCLEHLLKAGETTLVESILRRLRAASPEAISFLDRLRTSGSLGVGPLAGLALAEVRGLSAAVVPDLLTCSAAPDDLTRQRAAGVLCGGPRDPVHSASLLGSSALGTLLVARDRGVRAIGNLITWFFERLDYDSAGQIADWAMTLDRRPEDVVARRALGAIHHITPEAWEQVLVELRRRGDTVRQALLYSMALLAKLDHLGDGRWEALDGVMTSKPLSGLETPVHTIIELEDLCRVILEAIQASPGAPVGPDLIAHGRSLIRTRYGFSWADLFRLPEAGKRLIRLKAIGESQFTKDVEPSRWQMAVAVAARGTPQPGFIEVLAEWTMACLTEPDHWQTISCERSGLIELLAGAAASAPATFLRCGQVSRLRLLFVEAAQEAGSFTIRGDAVRLLGYMRHLTRDVLPALRSTLTDVDQVRESALEAVHLFRRMDADVIPELITWLTDDSELLAFATAQLLAAIGRHTQMLSRTDRSGAALRREIVKALAAAVRDPRSDRRLAFGSLPAPTAEIPRLRDYFYGSLLKVAGYEQERQAEPPK